MSNYTRFLTRFVTEDNKNQKLKFLEIKFQQEKTKDKLSVDELEYINVFDPNAYKKLELFQK